MRKVLPVLLLTSLSACAFPQTRWEKPGTDEKTAANDFADCRRAAQQEAFEISPHYGWYRPLPWQVRPWYGYSGDPFYAENRLTDFCMRNKGYQLVTIKPPQTKAPAPAGSGATTDK